MRKEARERKRLKEPNESMTRLLRLLHESPGLSKKELATILGYKSQNSIVRKCEVLKRLKMIEAGEFRGRLPMIRKVTKKGLLWLEDHKS